MAKLTVLFLDSVTKAIQKLNPIDQAKIAASVVMLSAGDFESTYIKPIKGVIRELIVRRERLLFFLKGDTVYFVNIFRKQSAKTPKREILHAENIYKTIQQKDKKRN